MDRKAKIDKIYEIIADKTLSFGCKLIDLCGYDNDYIPCVFIREYENRYEYITDEKNVVWLEMPIKETIDRKVIGHPVMIGDVLDRYDENIDDGFSAFDNRGVLALQFEQPRKSIDFQTNKCIDFIYSLIVDDHKRRSPKDTG